MTDERTDKPTKNPKPTKQTKTNYSNNGKPTHANLSDDVRESIPLLAVLHYLLRVNGTLLERLVVVGGEVEVLEALGGVGLVVPGHLLSPTEAREKIKINHKTKINVNKSQSKVFVPFLFYNTV